MTWTKTLLTEIEAFLAHTGMPPTQFGIEAINDGRCVRELRAGRTVTLRTADKLRAFMRDWRPAKKPRKPDRRRSGCSASAA